MVHHHRVTKTFDEKMSLPVWPSDEILIRGGISPPLLLVVRKKVERCRRAGLEMLTLQRGGKNIFHKDRG